MSDNQNALRLADELDEFHGPSKDHASYAAQQAAAEIRRLVDENEALTKDLGIHIHYYRRLLADNEALKADAQAFRTVVWNCMTLAVRPHEVEVFDEDKCLVSIPTEQICDTEAARDAVKVAVEKLNE